MSAARRLSGPVRWEPGSLGALRRGVRGLRPGRARVIALVGGAAGVALAVAAGAAAFGVLALGLRVLAADDAAWLDGTSATPSAGARRTLLRRAAAR